MMMGLSKESVGRSYSEALGRLGLLVGRHPLAFILIPLMIALLFGTGVQKLHYVDDAEYLFSPKGGEGKAERALVEHNFPQNQTGGFSPSRLVRMSRLGRLLAVARDGGSVLRRRIFDELKIVDAIIRNVTVTYESRQYGYNDLCAHWHGRCLDNAILLLAKIIDAVENHSQPLHYPITFDSDAYQLIVLPAHLGGIERDADANMDNDQVWGAKVVALGYFVRSQTPTEDKLGRLWERAFEATIQSLRLEHIDVVHFTSETLQQELNDNLREGTPYVILSFAIMIVFSALTSTSFDCVRSKAWLSMAGVVCTGLGILSAFGLLIYIGLDFAGVNYAIPFLALGIGLDDTFVMISCWQQTDSRSPVPHRLQETLRRAGISITITSLTDFLSFLIGVITPFEAIRMFCIYIAATVLFIYLIHITMFTAFMAYAGYMEEDNRHGLICIQIPRPSDARNESMWYRLLCTGGEEDQDIKALKPGSMGVISNGGMANVIATHSRDAVILKLKNPRHYIANALANWIDNGRVKVAIFMVFLVYLIVAIWGLVNLSEGLDVRNLCRYKSNASRYYDLDSRYFQQYRVQLVVNGHVPYWMEDTQKAVETMVSTFENRTAGDERILTESWMRSFIAYIRYTRLTVDTEQTFIEELRKFIHNTVYELDIKFSSDGRHIEASRFLIQTEAVTDAELGTRMMEELRALAKSFQPILQVTIFNPYFVYFDQFVMVRPYTWQCIFVAALVMIIVATVFLPHLVSTVCIALAMISIEVGVIGLMSIWGIKLDAIAMINLIMCIGFSVDFSAHVTHAFLSAPASESASSRSRICYVYITAGLPVVQGATSTILALIPLLMVPSYISEVFFKVTFLVSTLGAIHALLLLPVLLTFLQSDFCRRRKPSVAPYPNTGTYLPRPQILQQLPAVKPQVSSMLSPVELVDAEDDFGLGTSADESSIHSSTTDASTPRVKSKSTESIKDNNRKQSKEVERPVVSTVELQHFTPQHGHQGPL